MLATAIRSGKGQHGDECWNGAGHFEIRFVARVGRWYLSQV